MSRVCCPRTVRLARLRAGAGDTAKHISHHRCPPVDTHPAAYLTWQAVTGSWKPGGCQLSPLSRKQWVPARVLLPSGSPAQSQRGWFPPSWGWRHDQAAQKLLKMLSTSPPSSGFCVTSIPPAEEWRVHGLAQQAVSFLSHSPRCRFQALSWGNASQV